jgi:chemotaxis protein histidine kinase CheA/ActR/RegA family two-component response regulator
MNIDDLLALLSAEYGEGLEAAKRPLAMYVDASASQVAENAALGISSLADTGEFIERSIAAASLVNLKGLAGYLSHANEVVQAIESNDSMLASALANWSRDALDVAASLIASPSAPEAIELVTLHASQSPLTPSPEWLDQLAIDLMEPPGVTLDEDDAAQHRFDPVSPDDVSLATDNADPELLASMLHDAPRQLERLYRDLKAYAGQERTTVGQLAEAQRIAHTLKGSGNIIGIPGVARIAHRLEDTLIWLDSDILHEPAAQRCAVRDATQACETLQQMVAYLSGEDSAPNYSLPVLERMQAWAEKIYLGEVDEFAPPPIAIAAAVDANVAQPVAANDPVARTSDGATLRVASERVTKLVKRAGQSLANAQRTAQSLRTLDDTLQTTQQRQQSLRARLDELQQTVDRQVVALQARRDEQGEFDPLELDRYDALHLLARVVAEAVQDQVELTQQVREGTQRLITDLRDEQRELRQQHRELLEARLVSFATLVPRLRRNVAQTSATLGKSVQIEIVGEETTVDADVLSQLTEPLLHLLRNAVDHGIESPEYRALAGKSQNASITLRCVRDGQSVRIELTDDGRGLDTDAIVAKAVEVGLIDGSRELSIGEIHNLILQRGFSTKTDVTDVSGRGLGLDIVNDRVKAMKGHLSIASQPGEGTRFTMRVPVSSGIAASMLAQCAGQRVAISSDQVVNVLPPGSVVGEATHIDYGDARVPIVSLAKWMGFAMQDVGDASTATLILAYANDGVIALAVDRVLEVRELVLQDIGGLLRRVAGIQTGALTDDGSPLFMVDIAALELRARSGVVMSAALALQQRAAVNRTRVLVVDDALSARRAVEHVFEDQGYEVHTASDGFEALEILRKHPISLVATDLEMPNLNGLDLTKRMREVPAWSAIPVVMITSRGGERHRQAAINVGVNEYLVKPFSDRQLVDVTQSFLRAKQAAA